ncbi:MAG: O-phospho-L-seryl-tRNA:Cys-tRNA synthase [bacterium]
MEIPKEHLQRYLDLKRDFREDKCINLHPIQRGGVLSEEARKAINEFGDGYSTCDWCPPKSARLDMIEKPPIKQFLEDLTIFLGMDVARVVTRCREAKWIAFSALAKPGDYVVLDSLAHYSSYVAAEVAGLRVKEVPHSGYPEFKLDLDSYKTKIEEVKNETGKLPAVVLLTHTDYLYGNLNDPGIVAEISREYGIPFLLNAAYTAGIMPINGKQMGVDIIVSSGHKSWAASAPTGILAMKQGVSEKILSRSEIVGDWSGRKFSAKERYLLGCTVMGAPFLSLIASFPYVVERVKLWDKEIENVCYLVSELEKIEGIKQIGTRPKEHTLTHIESSGFDGVAKRHKKRGYFLYEELKKRGIVGIQPGMTKHFKLNTYGLSKEKIQYVAQAFKEIAKDNGLNVV